MDPKLKVWYYILGGTGLLGMVFLVLQSERIPSLVLNGYQGFVDLRSNSSWSSPYQSNVSWRSAFSNLNSLFRLPSAADVAVVTKRPRPGDVDYVCENDTRKGITLEHTWWHRLGNTLYELAGLTHLAEINDRKLIIPQSMVNYLEEAFGIGSRFCKAPNKLVETVYRKVLVQQEELEKNDLILPDRVKNSDVVYLKGFFQSRNIYVKPVEARMREMCIFRQSVVTVAKGFIHRVSKPGYVNVGVHLRAGSFERLSAHWSRQGFIVPGNDYFNRSFDYFENLYPKVQYIVCSHDRDAAWIAANFKHPNVVTNSRKHSAPVDMAILSLCDHVITSVGTFGWWAGWFNRGTMIYASNATERNNPEKPRGALGLPSIAHGFRGIT